MKEIGIDISKQRSKHIDEFMDQSFDVVITVCDHAKKSCPYFPMNLKQLHWSFPDPPHHLDHSEVVMNRFREVRDLIHKKFRKVAQNGELK